MLKQDDKSQDDQRNTLVESLLSKQGPSQGPPELFNENSKLSEKKRKVKRNYEQRGGNVLEGRNFLSVLFFSWIRQFMSFGNSFQLTKDNVPVLPESQRSKTEFSRFYNFFQETPDSERSGVKLTKTIAKTYSRQLIILAVQLIFYTVGSMVAPVLTGEIIKYIEGQTRETSRGVALFAGVFGISLFTIVAKSHIYYRFGVIGFNLSNTLSLMIYEKSLKHPILCLKKFSVSEVINYSQVDAQRMTYMGYQLSAVLFTPLQVSVGIWLMYSFIGVSFLSGTGVMLLTICLTFFSSRFSKRANEDVLKAKDARMKVTEEVFNIIRFIKVNAFEKYFFNKLNAKRRVELAFNKRRLLYTISIIFTYWLATPLILSMTFLTFVLLGNQITTTQAFTTIMLFGILQTPIRMIPTALSELIQMWTSIQRIQKYLVSDEMDYSNIRTATKHSHIPGNLAVRIQNGSYKWGKDREKKVETSKEIRKREKEEKRHKKLLKRQLRNQAKAGTLLKEPQSQVEDSNSMINDSLVSEQKMRSSSVLEEKQSEEVTSSQKNNEQIVDVEEVKGEKLEFIRVLEDINLQIERNTFTMIIGDIGSGKSSLLHSILNEMRPTSESQIEVNGTIAYVAQKPWIMAGSVKDNIVFMEKEDKGKFQEAIKYASMESDIELLVDGENTEIGEKGVNLSGGQKVRVALARALYSDREIYLLDDIISAVDVHVGQYLIKETILGYLKGKTVVMPTHAVKFAEYADKIIVMRKGRVTQFGTYSELKDTAEFQDIVLEEKEHEQEENSHNEKDEEIISELRKIKSATKEIKEKQHLSSPALSPSQQHSQGEGDLMAPLQLESKNTTEKIVEQLMMPEDHKKGGIGLEVYKEYLQLNGGWPYLAAVVLCLGSWMAFSLLSNVWMERWCENPAEDSHFYLYMFLAFGIGSSFFMLGRAYMLIIGGIKCGSTVHKKVIKALLYASLNNFHNRVPKGRIINRLTKDMRIIDEAIGFSVGGFLISAFRLFGTLFICLYAASVWIVLPMVLVAFLCNKLREYYMKTQRECVRLESITSSPIVSGFLSAINGISTIRAYNMEEKFLEDQIAKVDHNRRLRICRYALEGWFCQRLSYITFLINMTAIGYCMFSQNDNAALAGLLLSYALNLSDDIINTIFSFTYLETQMVSVERISAFMKIEPEHGYEDYTKVWRTKEEGYNPVIERGEISFVDTRVRYGPNMPEVLKGISIDVKAGEKVGIVGRTGAGKSTVINCLLRILDSCSGQILIDGKEIKDYFLKDLRYGITMIDQEPTLITASFKENLDPRHAYSDEELFSIIKECNLLHVVESKGGLDSQITNESLSVGEKQLLCICRAFLKHSRVVLIDEATANIDQKNDQLIQEVIANKFEDSTVLTIAHRLSTLKSADKILVLGEGRVLEWGPPADLLQKQGGIYRQMCAKGKVSNEFLS